MNLDDQVQRVIPVGAEYVLMDTATSYAKSVDNLRQAYLAEDHSVHPTYRRQDGTTIPRPLTFAEVMIARLENPYQIDLWNNWFSSCTGIAYQKGSPKFKLNTQCRELIEIDLNFRGAFLSVEYGSLREEDGWKELDSRDRFYNQLLTREQVKAHHGWQVLVGEDGHLLSEYTDLEFSKMRRYPTLDFCFWIRINTEQDELRAACVNSLDGGSDAGGGGSLGDNTRFLRVVPPNQ